MNRLGVLLCTLALAGAASAGLWTRAFDPDLVERPAEEFEAEYQRHLSTRQAKEECTADQIAACKEDTATGWILAKPGKTIPPCAPIAGQETESKLWVPHADKPCCKYHGCVVADCKALRAQFRYDETKECTVDDKEGGAKDVCKHRVEKRTCGCMVKECEVKKCAKNVTCGECLELTANVDVCGCQTEKDSCKPKPPPKGTDTCDKVKKCPKCSMCKKENIFGEKCANKYKELDKSLCEPIMCPASEECSPCQNPVQVSNKDGCCKRIGCEDLPPVECVKPDPKTGKCASECEEPVDVPLTSNKACKKTTKCCQKKKCVEAPAEECEGCMKLKTEKDACGCINEVCKLDERVEMCKLKIDYKVTVKNGGVETPALQAFTKFNANDRKAVPKTNGVVKVKITGACTPEEKTTGEEAPKKECIVTFKSGTLNSETKRAASVDKNCENIGIIEKVEVEQDTDDLWFVEEVVIEKPVDPKNPKVTDAEKVPINKFVGKVNPKHTNWPRVGPWQPTAEVLVNKPFECKKCEEIKVEKDINCTALSKGHCEPKACPASKPCKDCDISVPVKDDCNCAGNICVPTYLPGPDPEEPIECPEGSHPKLVSTAVTDPKKCYPGGKKETWVCQPDPCPCEEPPAPECTQCEEVVSSESPIVIEDRLVCICKEKICGKRDACMTKEEAQKNLNCHSPCEEPVETEEELECGCKKWKCGPRNVQKCSEPCSDCEECTQTFSPECERPIFECVKVCPPQKDCQVPKLIDGKPALSKCNCPVFVSKPCVTDPVHACDVGKNKVVEGTDRCGCDTKIVTPCEALRPPTCNGTCHELLEESDGCCKTWTCQKKPCPEVEKPECPKCHEVVVHDDECKCCKSTCEPITCPAVERCPEGEKPIIILGECNCPVLVKCTPEGGNVKVCPKDKTCKDPTKAVELCGECVDAAP